MPSNSDILKEYLIALGYKVDEASFKKFTDSIIFSQLKITGLATAAVGATSAIATLVTQVTDNMNKLFLSAQVAGDTVKDLNAFQLGATKAGLSVDQATNSLSRFNLMMKANPGGMQAWLGSLKIDPNESTTKQYIDVIDRLAHMPRPAALQLGQTLGFDPAELTTLMSNVKDLREGYNKGLSQTDASGVDLDKLGKTSHELKSDVADLENTLGLIGDQIAAKFVVPTKELVEKLNEVLTGFMKLNAQTDGNLGVGVTAVGGAAGAIGAAKILKKVTGWGKYGRGAAPAADAAAAGAGAGGEAAAVAGRGALGWLGRLSAIATGIYYGGGFYQHTATPDQDQIYSNEDGKAYLPGFDGKVPLGLRQNNPGNLRANVGNDWTGKQPSTNGFEKFGSAMDGLRAMAQVLIKYGMAGTDTITGIVSKYAPASENDDASYIKDVTARMGRGATDHLNLKDPGTLQRLMASMIWHEQGQMPFSDAMLLGAANFRLGLPDPFQQNAPSTFGVRNATINVTNNINVTGGPTGQDTARHVSDAIQRVDYGDPIRNLQTKGN